MDLVISQRQFICRGNQCRVVGQDVCTVNYRPSKGVLVVLFSISVTLVTGYSHFRDLLPNGKKVPHPCRPNYIWKGVGHENPAGGGDRNPFGQDFDTHGRQWDVTLCEMDSDGDGRTNGEELGDPDCIWTPGDVPSTDLGLSHPGVCEPIVSETCRDQNNWEIDCSSPEFTCDPLDETEDVHNITLALDPTPVPAQETTYICQGMDLPADGKFHMIASEPYLVNENVLHHITIFGCPEHAIDEARSKYSEPVECFMSPLPCVEIFSLWTLGLSGSCLPSEYGMLIGEGGTQYVVLQLHWNNPEIRSDYEDSSGMTLYYTPNLRDYHGGTMSFSSTYLELNPGYAEVVSEGRCQGECTEYLFEETIYITEILPHMHYLGRRMIVEHWRNGELNATLVEDNSFSYDSPEVFMFQPPVEFLPGDEIVVFCHFETTGEGNLTFCGDATSDEMCSTIFQYYPMQANATYCGFIDDKVSYCGPLSVGDQKAVMCVDTQWDFFSQHFDNVLASLYLKCDPSGLSCWEGCDDVITQVRSEHICLEEDVDEVIKNTIIFSPTLTDDFVRMLISCDDRPGQKDSPSKKKYHEASTVSGSSSVSVTVSAAVLIGLLATQLHSCILT